MCRASGLQVTGNKAFMADVPYPVLAIITAAMIKPLTELNTFAKHALGERWYMTCYQRSGPKTI